MEGPAIVKVLPFACSTCIVPPSEPKAPVVARLPPLLTMPKLPEELLLKRTVFPVPISKIPAVKVKVPGPGLACIVVLLLVNVTMLFPAAPVLLIVKVAIVAGNPLPVT